MSVLDLCQDQRHRRGMTDQFGCEVGSGGLRGTLVPLCDFSPMDREQVKILLLWPVR
jgi:hypothetical protein